MGRKCNEIEFGTGGCAYFIYLPWNSEKCVAIDKCLLPEVVQLWEQNIKTTGCCCGHDRAPAFIGVRFEDIEKMKKLGYKVRHNPCRPEDEDSFIPKLKSQIDDYTTKRERGTKMKYLIFWNEDEDIAYGYKEHFKTEEEFIQQVKREFKSFDGKDCIVEDVRIEPCIKTEEGLPGDTLMPLSTTDIEIANYYTATVVKLD